MKHSEKYVAMLANPQLPEPHRIALLRDLASNNDPQVEDILRLITEKLTQTSAETLHQQKLAEVQMLLEEMKQGPKRQGVFLETFHSASPNSGPPQALVALDDGTLVYSALPEATLWQQLRQGDRVVLDGKGRAVLYHNCINLKIGEEARLERRLDDRHVEVSLRLGDKSVYFATHELMQKIKNGEIEPGASLIVNPRQSLALAALPAQNGLAHFQFLDQNPVPDVIVERDIGAPPRCIQNVCRHYRQELTDPEGRRGLKLRRSMMTLLCGVSGSGKTLAIQGIHREMYQIMSEVTGVPIEHLPPRVFRFRSGQILNQWLGQSDKNVDRFFDEIEELAGQPFVAPDGTAYELGCLVVIEEADGMGRRRGQDAIYDRILTGILQRLDPNSPTLRDKLVVFLATTNEPHIVDPAILRRVGGTMETFGRLHRAAFRAVLQKHLFDRPALSDNGCTQEQLRRRLMDDLTAWLFAPPSTETGLVELIFAGSTNPVVKYRRDFLTGALVDRAVQQASQDAYDEWECQPDRQCQNAGLTLEQLQRAFDEQIRALAGQVTEFNAAHYLDLPDGARVNSVRRLAQPQRLPIEYRRSPAAIQAGHDSQGHSQSEPQQSES